MRLIAHTALVLLAALSPALALPVIAITGGNQSEPLNSSGQATFPAVTAKVTNNNAPLGNVMVTFTVTPLATGMTCGFGGANSVSVSTSTKDGTAASGAMTCQGSDGQAMISATAAPTSNGVVAAVTTETVQPAPGSSYLLTLVGNPVPPGNNICDGFCGCWPSFKFRLSQNGQPVAGKSVSFALALPSGLVAPIQQYSAFPNPGPTRADGTVSFSSILYVYAPTLAMDGVALVQSPSGPVTTEVHATCMPPSRRSPYFLPGRKK